MEKKTIGAFICVLRKASGMTQRQLAEKLNVSDKAVSRWERDETLPDLTLIPIMAEIFGVTSDELLRGQRSTARTQAPQSEEKSQKQLKYLLDRAAMNYKISTLLVLLVAAIGVIVAAILNLAFLRAIAGFWVGCVFFLGAAVAQVICRLRVDAALQGEEFQGEALADCRRLLGQWTFWSIGLMAALFAFNLPLLGVKDAYAGLTLGAWLCPMEAANGYVYVYPQPALVVLAGVGVLWLLLRLRGKKWRLGPKGKLLLRTVVILAVVSVVLELGQQILMGFLFDNRQLVASHTAFQSWEDFEACSQQLLGPDGQALSKHVLETDSQGNPTLIELRWPDGSIQSYQNLRYLDYGGERRSYFRLNQQMFQISCLGDTIYAFTMEEFLGAAQKISSICNPVFLGLRLAACAGAAMLCWRKIRRMKG